MRKRIATLTGGVCLCLVSFAAAQEAVGPRLYDIEEAYLRWPLPDGLEQYGTIDGVHLKGYVREITAISRRSRDRGEQYWGRIPGTASDKETQEWLVTKFREIGLEEVRVQEFALSPYWYPTSWEVVVSGAGSVVPLATARPVQWAGATPPGGMELDAVWVGLGTLADFLVRDVTGKAVFIHSNPTPGMRNHSAVWNGAMRRAQDRGAAAVIVVFAMPGNVSSQLISSAGVTVPLFSVGLEDGTVVRELVERGHVPKVRLRLDVTMATGRTSANVWGVLPGTTDEDIVVMAHTDGHYDAALDNAAGMATMLGLAEYFASVPRDQRRRTIKFVGVPNHHSGQGQPRELRDSPQRVGSEGTRWMRDNGVFARTAMLINAEHTSQTQTYLSGEGMVKGNIVGARRWFVSGTDRFKRLVVEAFDLFGVATYERPEARPGGELSQVYQEAPGVHVIDHIFYHTDMDTEEFIPPTGLESTTRAYAYLIDEVNRLELSEVRTESMSQP